MANIINAYVRSMTIKKRKTILVIEDEPLLTEAIAKKFSVNHLEIVACSTVQEALDYLHSNKPIPDAVWLDYYLPDGTGLVFLNAFRANSAYADVPVFAISNSASAKTVQAMRDAGAQKYYLKAEYRLGDLVDMVIGSMNGVPSAL